MKVVHCYVIDSRFLFSVSFKNCVRLPHIQHVEEINYALINFKVSVGEIVAMSSEKLAM